MEKSTWKQCGYFAQPNYTEKVRGNDVNFPTIEITSKIVRGNDVDFLISNITSKKYVEMTWKFVEIWSSSTQYPLGIDIDSTWCAGWDVSREYDDMTGNQKSKDFKS